MPDCPDCPCRKAMELPRESYQLTTFAHDGRATTHPIVYADYEAAERRGGVARCESPDTVADWRVVQIGADEAREQIKGGAIYVLNGQRYVQDVPA